jgi:Icc-related predicted phosphoesterase
MRFIYTTDLHGNHTKYETVLQFAVEHQIKLLHLGADLLPKRGPDMPKLQREFINIYLKKFYQRCAEEGIKVLAFFGNDDLSVWKNDFRKYGSVLDETPYEQEGYVFTAYPFVPDYPFRLKTACKVDHKGWHPEKYFGTPLEFTENGFEEIKDIEDYFARKGTIQEDLQKITGGKKTIIAIHTPPTGLSLDVCLDGREVGSLAVREWIEKEQPLLVLSGHIHENAVRTGGVWKSNLGRTTVIQPGQMDKTNLVMVEIQDGVVELKLVVL